MGDDVFSGAVLCWGANTAWFEIAFAGIGAVWIDREAGVKIYEHYYDRGLRENGRGVGMV